MCNQIPDIPEFKKKIILNHRMPFKKICDNMKLLCIKSVAWGIYK